MIQPADTVSGMTGVDFYRGVFRFPIAYDKRHYHMLLTIAIFLNYGFIATKVRKPPQGSTEQVCSENPDIGIRAAGVSVLGFRMKNIQ
jgi:hypothetical protein